MADSPTIAATGPLGLMLEVDGNVLPVFDGGVHEAKVVV